MATGRPDAEAVPVEVTCRGQVLQSTVDYARTKVERVVRFAHEPVLNAHVVLSVAPDPAVERWARAEASLNVNGSPLRAHAITSDMLASVDLLEGKLQKILVQHADRIRTRHRWIGAAADHEWRHGDLPTPREAHFPRPPDERDVVRRKSFALEPMTPDEAAFDMDMLGHDFYLFTDLRSGKDAIVYHNGDGRFAVRGEVVPEGETATLVTMVGAAPRLSESEAKSRLDLTGEPFIFYLDAESGRGRVMYLRYDGHYGLITASDG